MRGEVPHLDDWLTNQVFDRAHRLLDPLLDPQAFWGGTGQDPESYMIYEGATALFEAQGSRTVILRALWEFCDRVEHDPTYLPGLRLRGSRQRGAGDHPEPHRRL